MATSEHDKFLLASADGSRQDETPGLPKVRNDLEITEQVYYGKGCYVLKDPTTLRYYRLRPPEYAIYQMLDGKSTMDDVLKTLAERFPSEKYDAQAVMSFIIMLRSANLLHIPGAESTEYLLKRKQQLTRGFFQRLRTEFLFLKFPLLDPEKLLNYMHRHLGSAIFGRAAAIFVAIFLAGAIYLVLDNVDKLGQRQPLLSWLNLLYFGASLLLIKVIHEFGHGLTAKHYGCEVHEMGFLLLVFMPCFYCDVSDAWMIGQKAKRMWITAAGIVVEMLLAACGAYIWAMTEPKTVLNQFALNLMLAASINTILFNGNPLLRFDGYYFLMDLVEIPNLKQKGSGYLWYLMQRYVLGVENAPEPIDVRGREWTVLGYAICSAIYRWFIMFAILYIVWTFLDKYGLGLFGAVMTLACVYNSFITPPIRFVKFLFTQHQRIKLHLAAMTVLVLIVGGVAYGVLIVPVEQTVETQCVLRPGDMQHLYVAQGGFLQADRNGEFVQDGKLVEEGEILLVLSEPELENRLLDLQLQLEQAELQLGEATADADRGLAAELAAQIKGLQAQYDRAKHAVEKLTIRAPLAGRLQLRTPVPLEDMLGSYMPLRSALFGLYQPGRFEAVLAISHLDIGLLEQGQLVRIKLWAMDDEVFEAEIHRKPEKPVQRLSSAAFSTVFHGQVATLPAAEPQDAIEPANNTYELEVSLPDDIRFRDGLVGQAKVIVEEKTLGEAVYLWFIRTLRQDIRLL